MMIAGSAFYQTALLAVAVGHCGDRSSTLPPTLIYYQFFSRMGSGLV
jgi:hypothetical protein